MTIGEYYNKLYNIVTSLAATSIKEKALIKLDKEYKSYQQKNAELLSDIEQSSPEVPNLFYTDSTIEA